MQYYLSAKNNSSAFEKLDYDVLGATGKRRKSENHVVCQILCAETVTYWAALHQHSGWNMYKEGDWKNLYLLQIW